MGRRGAETTLMMILGDGGEEKTDGCRNRKLDSFFPQKAANILNIKKQPIFSISTENTDDFLAKEKA